MNLKTNIGDKTLKEQKTETAKSGRFENFVMRLQRKRTKGWKMPKNSIYVGRPTKWGNPFKIIGDMIYLDAGYRRKILDKWIYVSSAKENDIVKLYEMLITGIMQPGDYSLPASIFPDILHWVEHFEKLDVNELKGKNLLCFCKLGEPCHADILLKVANA